MYVDLRKWQHDELIPGYRGDRDANQGNDLVPEGRYTVKVYADIPHPGRGWEQKSIAIGRMRVHYSETHVITQVVGGDYNGWAVRSPVSTLRRGGKESTVADLLRAVGALNVANSSQLAQSTLIGSLNYALAQEPICRAAVGWVATRWDIMRGRSIVVCRSMRKFPVDALGRHVPEIVGPGGELALAHNTVRNWQPVFITRPDARGARAVQ